MRSGADGGVELGGIGLALLRLEQLTPGVAANGPLLAGEVVLTPAPPIWLEPDGPGLGLSHARKSVARVSQRNGDTLRSATIPGRAAAARGAAAAELLADPALKP